MEKDTDLPRLRKLLAKALPDDAYSFEESAMLAYSVDNSRLRHVPDCVVWPASEAEVVEVVKIANQTATPVHARGRGTATTGSSLAEGGGMVLSTERMDKILEVDATNRTATVQPGVITGNLDDELEKKNLFWPPDPSSSRYSSVGGNIATAAAGPRGLRYGGVRENVLALRAVCGDGTVVRSGARVQKSSVGYDLGRLLVGSEGTLAIITEATVKLVPVPGASVYAVAGFASDNEALAAVARLMGSSANPSQAEFVDEGCRGLIEDESLSEKARALLFLATEGVDESAAKKEMEMVKKAIGQASPVMFEMSIELQSLWSLRKVISQRLRDLAAKKVNEDVVVPVGRLTELVDMARTLSERSGLVNLNFGHAGVGNLHVNLLFDDDADYDKAHQVVAKIMAWVVEVGGSISGEHGVGIAKRGFVPLQVDADSDMLMARIKGAFDPNGILRPLALSQGFADTTGEG